MRFGLIGNPLGHSFSPRVHAMLGDYDYKLYPIQADELDEFLAAPDLGGLNVTIPYKKEVMRACRKLSESAREIGAVNVLIYTEEGVIGHNTDAEGLIYTLKRAGIDPAGRKALILGTGGTSSTAEYCLKKLGARKIIKISRSGQDNYGNIKKHADADIIINTTPVGMYPDCAPSMIDLRDFASLEGVVDVIYNPLRTELILQAEELGIPCSGGLPMLIEQAVASYRLFFKREAENDKELPEVTEKILKSVKFDIENIVIIGMPGCGKSSIGKRLAELQGRRFVDLDSEIEKAEGMTPGEIIETKGEEYFRDAEEKQAEHFGKMTGLVIACGGGTPIRDKNVRSLKRNGCMVFIERDIDKLAVSGRPLSVNLPELYERRLPFYAVAADITIKNKSSVEDAAEEIVRKLKSRI